MADITAQTLARARRAALLSDLDRSELVRLGTVLASAVRHAADVAGYCSRSIQAEGIQPSDRDAMASDLQDILSDDVLGMLLSA